MAADPVTDNSDADDGAALARAEAALKEALDERNRLWDELQRKQAVEADLAFWRSRAEGYEESRWWKLGKPLRVAKRVIADPDGTLDAIAHDLRQRRRPS